MSSPSGNATRRLILASSSPQRRELLQEAGYEFDVLAPESGTEAWASDAGAPPRRRGLSSRTSPSQVGIASTGRPTSVRGDPRELAERLAYFKARPAADRIEVGLVLGADTICALGEQVLGKPTNDEEARHILRTLAGTRHQVITGLCLIDAGSGLRLIGSEATWVTMRPMSDSQIEQYVASGAGAGKAGAYAVQMEHDPYVETMEGSVSNVVGLPMDLFARMLRVMKGL